MLTILSSNRFIYPARAYINTSSSFHSLETWNLLHRHGKLFNLFLSAILDALLRNLLHRHWSFIPTATSTRSSRTFLLLSHCITSTYLVSSRFSRACNRRSYALRRCIHHFPCLDRSFHHFCSLSCIDSHLLFLLCSQSPPWTHRSRYIHHRISPASCFWHQDRDSQSRPLRNHHFWVDSCEQHFRWCSKSLHRRRWDYSTRSIQQWNGCCSRPSRFRLYAFSVFLRRWENDFTLLSVSSWSPFQCSRSHSRRHRASCYYATRRNAQAP